LSVAVLLILFVLLLLIVFLLLILLFLLLGRREVLLQLLDQVPDHSSGCIRVASSG
jgi:hypothetical protein